MKYDCVIWDWNGTVFSDLNTAINAVNLMLEKRNMPKIGVDEYRSYIDIPIYKFYAHLFDLEKVEISELLEEYNSNYYDLLDGSEVTAGTRRALEAVKRQGARQIILSACYANRLNEMLKKYEIADYFTDVLGADDYHCRDKSDKALDFIAAEGISTSRVVVIGDSCNDADVAERIGCDCILLTCGHQLVSDLESSGCPLVESCEAAVEMII